MLFIVDFISQKKWKYCNTKKKIYVSFMLSHNIVQLFCEVICRDLLGNHSNFYNIYKCH